MSKNRLVAIILMLVLFFGMLAIAKMRNQKKVVKTTAQVQQEVGIPVQTASVEVGSINDTAPVTGAIKALDSVSLSSKVPGKVLAVAVREGDVVKRGQVVVQIDPSDAQDNLRQAQAGLQAAVARLSQAKTNVTVTDIQTKAGIQQAKAGLAAAQSNLQKVKSGARTQERLMAENQVTTAKANLDNAQSNLHRYKQLYSQGAVAASLLDTYQTQYNISLAQYNSAKENLSLVQEGARSEDIRSAEEAVTQARQALITAKANASQTAVRMQDVTSAKAGIAQAQAQVGLAIEQLNNTALKSPVDGIVSQRMADPGQSVNATIPLLQIVNVRTVFFQADISETVLSKIHPGQTVDVKVDAFPNMTFIGKVAKINPSASVDTRNFGVRVQVPNAANRLRPGMFARGSVITASTSGAVLIPQTAVEDRNGKYIVFTVAKDAKNTARVKLHTINRGLNNAQFVELNPPTDIKVGDTVVTSGHESLDDNAKVLVKG